MNGKKILGWVMKTPLIFLILSTAFLGFYAAAGGIEGFRISYASPIVLTILILLYGIGMLLHSRSDNAQFKSDGGQDYLDATNSDYDEETKKAIEQYEAGQQ